MSFDIDQAIYKRLAGTEILPLPSNLASIKNSLKVSLDDDPKRVGFPLIWMGAYSIESDLLLNHDKRYGKFITYRASGGIRSGATVQSEVRRIFYDVEIWHDSATNTSFLGKASEYIDCLLLTSMNAPALEVNTTCVRQVLTSIDWRYLYDTKVSLHAMVKRYSIVAEV